MNISSQIQPILSTFMSFVGFSEIEVTEKKIENIEYPINFRKLIRCILKIELAFKIWRNLHDFWKIPKHSVNFFLFPGIRWTTFEIDAFWVK